MEDSLDCAEKKDIAGMYWPIYWRDKSKRKVGSEITLEIAEGQ